MKESLPKLCTGDTSNIETIILLLLFLLLLRQTGV